MKVVGLITEYNPFHNGHLYHINEARKMTGADYVVVVMSGNFVQRGGPAIIDKYKRTQMALENGADVVFELPVTYSCSSAEYFASGAVALLDKLGVVDSLCFGSECGSTKLLEEIARVFVLEPLPYRILLRDQIKTGLSFPTARMKAFLQYRHQADLLPEYDDDLLEEVLKNPNNILGIEYLKALIRRSSAIRPYTLKRTIAGYHDQHLTENISSASAIRKALLQDPSLNSIRGQVPDSVFRILKENHRKTFPILSNDFSALLHYKLITYSGQKNLDSFSDITPDLAARINGHISEYESLDQYCDLIKTKQVTNTRVRRALLHILLDLKEDEIQAQIREDYVQYLRVLGFRKDATSILGQIKKKSSLPLVTKLATASKQMNAKALKVLHFDVLTSQIYHTIVTDKYAASLYNEYTQNLIIL